MRLVVVFGIFVSSGRSFSAHEIAGYCFGGGVRGLLPELELLRTEGSGGAGGMKVSGRC